MAWFIGPDGNVVVTPGGHGAFNNPNMNYLQPLQPKYGVPGVTAPVQGAGVFETPMQPTQQVTRGHGTFGGSGPQKSFGQKPAPKPATPKVDTPKATVPAAAGESGLMSRLKGLARGATLPLAALAAGDYAIGQPMAEGQNNGFGPIDQSYLAGEALLAEAADPRTSPAMGVVGNVTGSMLQMPGRVYAGAAELGSTIGQGVKDAFTPRGELEARDAAERQAAAPQGPNNSDNFLAAMGAGLTGDASSSPIDLGAVPAYDVPQLPMPDPAERGDYTEIRNMVAQMRPEAVDEQAMDNTLGMSILAGIGAGLMGADGADPGEALLRMGMGGMMGVASIDIAKKEAKEKFKNSMDEYLRVAIGVEKSAMENDAQYAARVYDVKLKQMMLDYEASQKMTDLKKPSLEERGGKLFIKKYNEETKTMQYQPISDSPAGRFERMASVLQDWGVTDPKQALTIAATAGVADARQALPAMTVGMLNLNGQTQAILDFIGGMGEDGKKFVSKYNSYGLPGTALEKEGKAARDTLLIQTLMNSPGLLSQAMQMAGVPVPIRNSYQQALESK